MEPAVHAGMALWRRALPHPAPPALEGRLGESPLEPGAQAGTVGPGPQGSRGAGGGGAGGPGAGGTLRSASNRPMPVRIWDRASGSFKLKLMMVRS